MRYSANCGEGSDRLSQTVFDLPREQLAHNAVRIRLFGGLELENQWGSVKESPGQKSAPLRLLKYLLLDPQRQVDHEEVMRNPWKDSDQDAVAARVRLRRLREMLVPMHLDGMRGLVSFCAGKYFLNPDYALHFDTEEFLSLIDRSEHISCTDQTGLTLCMQALKLYRGPLMEYTNTPWLIRQRAIYHAKFCKLGQNMINRMRALDTEIAFPMLWQLAAVVAPEEEQLHRDIIEYLVERKQQEQLTQYMQLLTRSDSAKWLRDTVKLDASGPESEDKTNVLPDDKTIHVKLFGPVELSNSNGCVVENPARQPRPFLLLKYLLIEPKREIALDEMIALWPPSKSEVNTEGTARVRLRRAREALKPLCLPKREQLIYSSENKYGINPLYNLKRDVDQFEVLRALLEKTRPSAPEGLELCVQAMELYRGPLMEHTKDALWLEKHRSYYRDAFCQVARETLKRIKLLRDSSAMELLCRRAAAIAPEDEQLHKAIMQYLLEHNMELETTRYLSLLTASGKATWLER